ncbi:MAG: serine/threonine protein kinase [Myxococcota bacterium]|nr:serine/threonine protein kinase [Myxococcota bacterium]
MTARADEAICHSTHDHDYAARSANASEVPRGRRQPLRKSRVCRLRTALAFDGSPSASHNMPGPFNPSAELEHGFGASPSSVDPLILRARERLGSALGNKWRLDEVLGVGGMATVYAASHRNGSRAALKILHPELSTHPTLRQQFLHEGYVANSVGHDGAVKILDDDVAEDGSLFLVTELLQGETLEERRVRLGGRIPQDEVLLLTDQLLDVLSSAHAHGVVHRDLKPENVFLTRAGRVKVLDFGIARLRDQFGSTIAQPRLGTGTPSFMSPEHAGGLEHAVDEQSDLWSCGALMFNLLSGELVHGGDTPNEQLVRAMTRHAPPIADVAPSVSSPVASVVDKALSFGKKERWRDARHMRQAVQQAYLELVGFPISEAPVPTAPRATHPSDASHVVDQTKSATGRRGRAKRGVWSSRARLAGLAVMIACLCIAAASVLGSKELVAMERSMVSRSAARSGNFLSAASRDRAPIAAETRDPSELPAVSPVNKREGGESVAAAPITTGAHVTPVAVPHRVQVQLPVAPVRVERSAEPAAKPARDCNPPYVIESDTGKKRWRLDCL